MSRLPRLTINPLRDENRLATLILGRSARHGWPCILALALCGAAATATVSFTSPAPGATEGRTDQGVDWSGVQRIVAVARGQIVNVYQGLRGFGTTIIERVGNRDIYYAEETGGGSPIVHVGQTVSQGQELAPGTGGVIEAGFWNPATGRSLGAPGYTEGAVTSAGTAFRRSISRTGARGYSTTNVPSYVPKQYVPWVRTAAQKTGIPATVVAAQIDDESSFDPTATSPTGAQGIAQFEPATWRTYGHGSPNNPADALPAYIALMSSLLHQYNGNIRNALAAYNAGSANLQAGYGYADAILAKAGVSQSATQGARNQQPIVRPGGGSAQDTGQEVEQVLADYESELDLPRTAPSSGFVSLSKAGISAPFQWWYQSFAGKWQSEQGG